MEEINYDELRQKSLDIYGDFMNKLTDNDKVTITRFIADTVDYIQKGYIRVCPFDIIGNFKDTKPSWYGELKSLFRRFPEAISNESVSYAQILTKIKLERMEEPQDISFMTMMVLKDKNTSVGGKIYFSHNSGIIMCIIPQNSIILSTFVLSHEIAHLIIDILGLEANDGDDDSMRIAIEMVADFFASFAYGRLLHCTPEKIKENLVQMMPNIAGEEGMQYNSSKIRHENLTLIADKISTTI